MAEQDNQINEDKVILGDCLSILKECIHLCQYSYNRTIKKQLKKLLDNDLQ